MSLRSDYLEFINSTGNDRIEKRNNLYNVLSTLPEDVEPDYQNFNANDTSLAEQAFDQYYLSEDPQQRNKFASQIKANLFAPQKIYKEPDVKTSRDYPEDSVEARELGAIEGFTKGLIVSLFDNAGAFATTMSAYTPDETSYDQALRDLGDSISNMTSDQMRADVALTASQPLVPWKPDRPWYDLEAGDLSKSIRSFATQVGTTVGLQLYSRLFGKAFGKAVGSASAFIAGQLGAQASTPEEVVTVPTAGFVGQWLGSTFAMTAIETANAIDQLEADGLPRDLIDKYARLYGMGSGIIEGSQQMMFGGKLGLKKLGVLKDVPEAKLKSYVFKKTMKQIADISFEGLEEMSQGDLLHWVRGLAFNEAQERDPKWKPTMELGERTIRDKVNEFATGSLMGAFFDTARYANSRLLGVADQETATTTAKMLSRMHGTTAVIDKDSMDDITKSLINVFEDPDQNKRRLGKKSELLKGSLLAEAINSGDDNFRMYADLKKQYDLDKEMQGDDYAFKELQNHILRIQGRVVATDVDDLKQLQEMEKSGQIQRETIDGLNILYADEEASKYENDRGIRLSDRYGFTEKVDSVDKLAEDSFELKPEQLEDTEFIGTIFSASKRHSPTAVKKITNLIRPFMAKGGKVIKNANRVAVLNDAQLADAGLTKEDVAFSKNENNEMKHYVMPQALTRVENGVPTLRLTGQTDTQVITEGLLTLYMNTANVAKISATAGYAETKLSAKRLGDTTTSIANRIRHSLKQIASRDTSNILEDFADADSGAINNAVDREVSNMSREVQAFLRENKDRIEHDRVSSEVSKIMNIEVTTPNDAQLKVNKIHNLLHSINRLDPSTEAKRLLSMPDHQLLAKAFMTDRLGFQNNYSQDIRELMTVDNEVVTDVSNLMGFNLWHAVSTDEKGRKRKGANIDGIELRKEDQTRIDEQQQAIDQVEKRYGTPESAKARMDQIEQQMDMLSMSDKAGMRGQQLASEYRMLEDYIKSKDISVAQQSPAEYGESAKLSVKADIPERKEYTVSLNEDGSQTTTVIRNPVADDYNRHKQQFKEDYPTAPTAGEIISRYTIDSDGNRYIWYASDSGHANVEHWLRTNEGLDVSQTYDERLPASVIKQQQQNLKESQTAKIGDGNEESKTGQGIRYKTDSEGGISGWGNADLYEITQESQRSVEAIRADKNEEDEIIIGKMIGKENADALQIDEVAIRSDEFARVHAIARKAGINVAVVNHLDTNIDGMFSTRQNVVLLTKAGLKDEVFYHEVIHALVKTDNDNVQSLVDNVNTESKAYKVYSSELLFLHEQMYGKERAKAYVAEFGKEEFVADVFGGYVARRFDWVDLNKAFNNLDLAKKNMFALYDLTKVMQEEETIQQIEQQKNEAFSKWFSDSKVVNNKGDPLVVYRGDFRDVGSVFEVQDKTGMLSGGSGGIYFTSDPEVASNYSKSKPFSEANYDDPSYIMVTYGGETVPLTDVRLSKEDQNKLRDLLLSYEVDEGQGAVIGKDTWDWHLKDNKNDVVATVIDLTTMSATMDQDSFVDWIDKSGIFERVRHEDPTASRSNVTPVYIKMENPLDIANATEKELKAIESKVSGGQFIADNIRAYQKGEHTGTVMVFLETEQREDLKDLGYDGVIDQSGGSTTKGQQHNVYIAFDSEQIKSAIGNRGTFDIDDPDIRLSVKDVEETYRYNKFTVTKDGTLTPKQYFEQSGKPEQSASLLFDEHINKIRQAILMGEPVNAEAVEQYGVSVPVSWIKDKGLYKPTKVSQVIEDKRHAIVYAQLEKLHQYDPLPNYGVAELGSLGLHSIFVKMARKKRAQLNKVYIRTENWKNMVDDEVLRAIPYAIEGTEWTPAVKDLHEKTVAELMESDEAKQVKKEAEELLKEIRSELNEFTETMTQKEWIKFFDNYVPHLYKAKTGGKNAKPYKFRTATPTEKKRVFQTYQEAEEFGYTIQDNMDISKMINVYSMLNWNVATNRRFLNNITQIKSADGEMMVIPVYSSREATRNNMSELEAQSIFSQLADKTRDKGLGGKYASKMLDEASKLMTKFDGAKRGYKWMESPYADYNGFWVHPDAMNVMKKAIDKPWDNKFVNRLTRFITWTKYSSLGFSLFHHGSLLESMSSASGYSDALKAVFGKQAKKMGFKGDVSILQDTLDKALKDPDFGSWWINRGLMVTLADPNLDGSIIDKDIDNVIEWANETKTPHAKLLAKGAKGIKAYKHTVDKFLWQYWHPAMKLYTAQKILTQYQEKAEQLGTAFDLETAGEQISQYVNNAFGGQEWDAYEFATPKAKQFWHMIMFAPDWTMSNLQISGLPVLLDSVGVKGLSQVKGAIELKEMAHNYWRRMMITMTLFPALLQASIYGLTAPFREPEDDDEVFSFNNEYGQEFAVDITPIHRLMARSGIPVLSQIGKKFLGENGKQRYYIQWAKQAREVKKWAEKPLNSFYGKSSMAVKVAFEQILGISNLDGWETPWNNEHTNFVQSLPMRAASIGGKFVPMVLKNLFAGKPSTFFAPTRKGMSQYKATKALEQVFDAYARPSIWKGIKNNPDYVKNLDDLAPHILQALEKNGFDPDISLNQAISSVRSRYYEEYWQALNKNKTKDLEEIAEGIVRMNAVTANLTASMKKKYKDRQNIPYPSQKRAEAQKHYRKALNEIRVPVLQQADIDKIEQLRKIYGGSRYGEEYIRTIYKRYNQGSN